MPFFSMTPTNKCPKANKTSEQYQLKYATKKGEILNPALYDFIQQIIL